MKYRVTRICIVTALILFSCFSTETGVIQKYTFYILRIHHTFFMDIFMHVFNILQIILSETTDKLWWNHRFNVCFGHIFEIRILQLAKYRNLRNKKIDVECIYLISSRLQPYFFIMSWMPTDSYETKIFNQAELATVYRNSSLFS